MPRLTRSAPFAVLVAVGAAGAAAALLWPRSGVIDPLPVDAASEFTRAQLERARDYRGPQLALYAGTLLLQAATLAWLVLRARRWSARSRSRAVPRAPEPSRTPRPPRGERPFHPPIGGHDGRSPHPVARAALAGAAIAVLLVLVTLPLDAIMRQRSIDVGLTTRSWGGWAWDVTRSAAISAVFAAIAVAVAVALMRRLPSRWWLPASGLVVLAGVVLVFAGPLVIEPLANRFEKLPPGATRSAVEELADKAGVKVGEVYVVDASKRTTAANAYVTGLGSSKRVVLYDNLLERFSPQETRLVVAHELAHVEHQDVPRGLLFLLLVAPGAMWAVARLVRAWAPEPGGPAGPPTVPALFAAVTLVALLIGTVSNPLSRRVEARADSTSLRLTGDAQTFIAQQRRLALQNVSNPDPPWLVRTLLGTHPTTVQRIGAGRAWEAGERP